MKYVHQFAWLIVGIIVSALWFGVWLPHVQTEAQIIGGLNALAQRVTKLEGARAPAPPQ